MYSASVLPGSKIMQASLPCLNDMPSISLWTISGPEPAAGHRSLLILSLSFRQCLCLSLLSRRIATSVPALCAHGSIHTERQHAPQSLCCTVCQWQNVSSEWNGKERLPCVPLLLGHCCSQYCVQLGFNELANTVYHPTHVTFQTSRTCHLLSRRSFLMRFWIEMCRKVHPKRI